MGVPLQPSLWPDISRDASMWDPEWASGLPRDVFWQNVGVTISHICFFLLNVSHFELKYVKVFQLLR